MTYKEIVNYNKFTCNVSLENKRWSLNGCFDSHDAVTLSVICLCRFC